MKRDLIIFGTGEIAQLAHYYFTRDTSYRVVAFTVDHEFIRESVFCDLPVVPFEDIQQKFPPEQNEMFVALSYSKLNLVRKEKYLAAKKLGYRLASYISTRASVLNDGLIGDNCFIFEDNTIQPFVKIGNNVTLWSGNHIGHHSVIKDHTFIASHVVISGGVEVDEQCFIGVNATIRDHVKIGTRSIIGAGAIILSSTEADGLYKTLETPRAQFHSSKVSKI